MNKLLQYVSFSHLKLVVVMNVTILLLMSSEITIFDKGFLLAALCSGCDVQADSWQP